MAGPHARTENPQVCSSHLNLGRFQKCFLGRSVSWWLRPLRFRWPVATSTGFAAWAGSAVALKTALPPRRLAALVGPGLPHGGRRRRRGVVLGRDRAARHCPRRVADRVPRRAHARGEVPGADRGRRRRWRHALVRLRGRSRRALRLGRGHADRLRGDGDGAHASAPATAPRGVQLGGVRPGHRGGRHRDHPDQRRQPRCERRRGRSLRVHLQHRRHGVHQRRSRAQRRQAVPRDRARDGQDVDRPVRTDGLGRR